MVTYFHPLQRKALDSDRLRSSREQSAQEPIGGTPEPFATRLREDFDKYPRPVKDLNIKTAK